MTVDNLPLLSWNRRWDFDGAKVICTTCHAVQEQNRAESSFLHSSQCKARMAHSEYPLRDLYRILKNQIESGRH